MDKIVSSAALLVLLFFSFPAALMAETYVCNCECICQYCKVTVVSKTTNPNTNCSGLCVSACNSNPACGSFVSADGECIPENDDSTTTSSPTTVPISSTTTTISDDRLRVISSFDAPVGGGIADLAFDGEFLWLSSFGDGNIYKLDTNGIVIDVCHSPGHDPTGLTFDGEFLWNSDAFGNMVYKLDTSCSVIKSCEIDNMPNGFAFDGNYLWVTCIEGAGLFKMDIDCVTKESYYAPPGYEYNGLAFDGTFLWAVDKKDWIYKIDMSGNIIEEFRSPFDHPLGMTFDGTYYWLAAYGDNKIYQLDISSETTTTAETSTTTTTTIELTTTTTAPITTTTTAKCPCKKLYGEYSEETELLRYFRDNILSQTPEGQEIIRLYYEWSPAIVKAMEADEEFKEEVKEMIDGVLGLVGFN